MVRRAPAKNGAPAHYRRRSLCGSTLPILENGYHHTRLRRSATGLKSFVMRMFWFDIISFPSTHEGFGMPILEGQVVARPVLTSNLEPM
jgi:hypothetical protein